MKTRLMIIVILLVQATVALANDTSREKPPEIQWLTGVDQALAEAKSKNKPVFLDFFNPR